ncbi:MAG: hypothetical protein Q7T71_17910 [Herbiconiux sp.]|nr:hypothetical protein [Herbiconiux sp.]
MPETLDQAQARVLALNSDELPFVYTATPEGVQAGWKYADVKWVAIAGAGTLDASYELRVTLDPTEGTWEFHETDSQSGFDVQSSGGGFSIGGGASTFSGRQKKASFSFGGAAAASTTDRQGTQTGNTYGWSFSTDEVKQPLIAAFEAAGYAPRKRGLLTKLFGG